MYTLSNLGAPQMEGTQYAEKVVYELLKTAFAAMVTNTTLVDTLFPILSSVQRTDMKNFLANTPPKVFLDMPDQSWTGPSVTVIFDSDSPGPTELLGQFMTMNTYGTAPNETLADVLGNSYAGRMNISCLAISDPIAAMFMGGISRAVINANVRLLHTYGVTNVATSMGGQRKAEEFAPARAYGRVLTITYDTMFAVTEALSRITSIASEIYSTENDITTDYNGTEVVEGD